MKLAPPLVGLALLAGFRAGAQDTVARPSAATTDSIAVAPADVHWIVVKAENWKTESPSLEGKYVELSGGGMATQLSVNRNDSFSNTGWLIDSAGTHVGTVLFDQASDNVLRWMYRAKCLQGCHVFLRGILVNVDRRPLIMKQRNIQLPHTGPIVPELRLIEASYESHAGVAPAGSESLNNIAAADPGAHKPLLPQGAVPNKDATAAFSRFAAEAATDTTKTDTTKKRGGFLALLKSGYKAGGLRKQGAGKDGAQEGTFKWGDPPVLDTYYRNIRDTELYRLFANSAWNVGRNMWPRVALVVEDATGPGTVITFTKPGADLPNRCWRVSARLWTGPAASKDIPSFNWCLTEMHRYTFSDPGSGASFVRVAQLGISLWGMTPKTSMLDQNTGQQRTMGPNPPYLPAMRFHFRDDDGDEGLMLGNILRDMAFEFGVPDGRVWVVRIPGENP